MILNNFFNIHPQLEVFRAQNNNSNDFKSSKPLSFTGATDIFTKHFIETQKEIEEIFIKDPESNWIAGSLPAGWIKKLENYPAETKNEIIKKIFLAFRAAVKHLKPYNAPARSKEFNQQKRNLENRRIKEASHFLTKALRHFGIIPETNSVNLKRRKVTGRYIDRGYVLREKGKNPSLEKLFIKKFRDSIPDSIEADYNGVKAETAHWLNLNKLNCKYISKLYWGDIKGNYITSEYATPPRHISPIVRFKSSYQTLQDFYYDFQKQTGIDVTELIDRNINPGKTNPKGRYVPKSKEEIIIGYLQSELEKAGLRHLDLHKDNAVIGTDENGKAIVKIIDIGGVVKEHRMSQIDEMTPSKE